MHAKSFPQAFLLLFIVDASFAASALGEPLSLTECTLPAISTPARCGELTVPENPDEPDGRQLKIAVAVLPATDGTALPDPIVPLSGGPGEETIGAATFYAERVGALRRNRDILLVDQRGTGRSNKLRCNLHDPANPAPNLRDFFPLAAVKACAVELSQRSDLTQYTYRHFARDLEQVRLALGYGKLNLFAGSYGTRAAQVFLRTYPESVRTVFLGSVVPIDEVTPLTMAKASQAAFESTYDACAAETGCRSAFPNLRAEIDEVLKQLDAGTVRVPVPGSATRAVLDRGRVVEWLRARLYRPSTAAELPWLIHQAHAADWTPIVEGILEQVRGFDEDYGIGLFFSITCAEDLAFLREDEIAPVSENTYLGDYRVRQQLAACRHWPKASLPDGYREPVRSALPTMFVSGDMDAASPLWLTEHAATGFSNRVEIIARGQGHTEWNDCVGRLYTQFVETGKTDGIDPSSCPPIARPPFRTR